MDTVFPFSICQDCIKISELAILDLLKEEDFVRFCNQLDHYNVEVSALLRQSMSHYGAPTADVFQLIRYCCDFVVGYHAVDVKPEEASPLLESYNPPRDGRAYYFSKDGFQLRNMRSFPIDKERSSNEVPAVRCNKMYPQVSKKGTCYLFLWFCPFHGHCFGYHIIPNAEGRKDPAASLYMFKDKAPEVILYDFACSLDEYARNRESGYYSNTRFFHDVFHGYSHKCGSTFRCDRLKRFKLNSSICEQFNSFLQCIKASARLMSQTHFAFYVQFFIHIWNIEKFTNFNRRLDIQKFGEE